MLNVIFCVDLNRHIPTSSIIFKSGRHGDIFYVNILISKDISTQDQGPIYIIIKYIQYLIKINIFL